MGQVLRIHSRDILAVKRSEMGSQPDGGLCQGPKILTLQMLFLQRLFFEVPLRAAFAKSQARVNSMRSGSRYFFKNMLLNLSAHFFRFAGAMIDKVQINQMRLTRREDRLMWVKRRRRGSGALVFGANLFFRAAGNPVSVVEDSQGWRQQEISSFRLLNGEEFLAFSEDDGSVWLERLPGSDLDTLNEKGRLTVEMFYAAGLEFRRVHGLYSPRFRGPWSQAIPTSAM